MSRSPECTEALHVVSPETSSPSRRNRVVRQRNAPGGGNWSTSKLNGSSGFFETVRHAGARRLCERASAVVEKGLFKLRLDVTSCTATLCTQDLPECRRLRDGGWQGGGGCRCPCWRLVAGRKPLEQVKAWVQRSAVGEPKEGCNIDHGFAVFLLWAALLLRTLPMLCPGVNGTVCPLTTPSSSGSNQ